METKPLRGKGRGGSGDRGQSLSWLAESRNNDLADLENQLRNRFIIFNLIFIFISI